jgi:hypothetical protein
MAAKVGREEGRGEEWRKKEIKIQQYLKSYMFLVFLYW